MRGLRIRVTDVLCLLASWLTPAAVIEGNCPTSSSRTCPPASASRVGAWRIRSSRPDVLLWLDNQLSLALTTWVGANLPVECTSLRALALQKVAFADHNHAILRC